MARRRRRGKRRRYLPTGLIIVVVAALIWWRFFKEDPQSTPDTALTSIALAPQPRLTTDRPEIIPDSAPRPGIPEKGANPTSDRINADAEADPVQVRMASLTAAGTVALERNDILAARSHFTEALRESPAGADLTLLRAELTRIGNETIFSSRIFDGDPLVDRYIIQPGDALQKIARANRVSPELLAAVNGIADPNRIRAGQTIKIVKGPFHAVIDKSDYSLDVYLAGTFVKHFRVGLGIDGSTPSGEWRVKNKLIDPTYYPPRGGAIIAAGDPNNPLGERWIGLEGVSGEALGQLRYGIHGTIEPDSIGASVSLGCIRMYNEDVEALYTYLVEQHSTVKVRD